MILTKAEYDLEVHMQSKLDIVKAMENHEQDNSNLM
jgi:hypothetical protein